MKFEVRKPFTWAGQDLQRGDTLEIPDESTKIGPLTRAKFIRFASEALPSNVQKKAPEIPVQDTALGVESAQPVFGTGDVEQVALQPTAALSPKEVVRQAKARAKSKEAVSAL
ncbi:MAG: hypothetical protein V3U60_06925 [Gammaproteobacteria bacterium]